MVEVVKLTSNEDVKYGLVPPDIIYVYSHEDPGLELKAIPLKAVKSYAEFEKIVRDIYSLNGQAIEVTLSGDRIAPTLWNSFLTLGELYKVKFVPAVELNIVPTKGFSLKTRPQQKKPAITTISCWPETSTVWKTRYAIAEKLKKLDSHCPDAMSLRLFWKGDENTLEQLEEKTTMKEILEDLGSKARQTRVIEVEVKTTQKIVG